MVSVEHQLDKTHPTGIHLIQLIVDSGSADKSKLTDMEVVRRFLDTCPERIGMRKIMEPCVLSYRHEDSKNSGIAGIVIIADSHISVHTFPEQMSVKIDVFSCKDFDTRATLAYATEWFALVNIQTRIINRDIV